MKTVFNDIYRQEDGYNAGSSHAITGYKVREDVFVTLWHNNYALESIEVCCKAEHLMDDAYGNTKQTATLDTVTGEVNSNIPGVECLNDFLILAYMARYGEVVRDDC